MLVPNQFVEVKVIGPTLQHYRDLGYDVNYLDVIKVPVEHLTEGSKVVVQVKCDVCGKDIPRPYKQYLHYHSQGIDTCNEHKNIKTKVTCMEKYGVENIFQSEEFKEKHRQTCLERYGYEYISQVPEIRQKIEETCYEKYGGSNPMCSDEVKEKIAQTNMERYGAINPLQNSEIRAKDIATSMENYGVPYPMQSPEVLKKVEQTCMEKNGYKSALQSPEIIEKIKQTNLSKYGAENLFSSDIIKQKIMQTNLDRYGVPYAILNPEVREKAIQSYYDNGTVKTSAEQVALHKLVVEKYPSAELNKPFDSCFLDIYLCVDGIEIDIEYDGWYWHQDALRDIRRDKHLQSKGIKVLRVRSGSLLPTEQELFAAIDELITTDRKFKEIILSDWKQDKINEEEVSA